MAIHDRVHHGGASATMSGGGQPLQAIYGPSASDTRVRGVAPQPGLPAGLADASAVLTRLIHDREVALMFDGITPKYERALGVSILVEPRCSNGFREWSRERPLLIGTAFDYALRFEVQRMNPHARAGGWVAEGAWKLLVAQANSRKGLPRDQAACHARLAESVVRAAGACHRSYMRSGARDQSVRRELVGHAIRLAKLDDYYRKGSFDTSLTEVEDED